jgi:hypothetical protein
VKPNVEQFGGRINNKLNYLRSFMKPDPKKTFTSPRWQVLYTSIGMMTLGFIGVISFEWLSKHYPGSSSPHKFGRFFEASLFSALVGVTGVILCVLCSIWILIRGIHSNVSHKQSQ